MDSMEYSHWMAFEKAHGPINGEYDREALAAINEQLNTIAYLLGQAHFTDKTHKRGPIPKPERYPRPYESKTERRQLAAPEDDSEWVPPTEDEIVEFKIDPTETGEEE